jgi:hypothetical protein
LNGNMVSLMGCWPSWSWSSLEWLLSHCSIRRSVSSLPQSFPSMGKSTIHIWVQKRHRGHVATKEAYCPSHHEGSAAWCISEPQWWFSSLPHYVEGMRGERLGSHCMRGCQGWELTT